MTIRLAMTALFLALTSVHAALVETAVNSATQSAYSGDVSSADLLHGLTGVDSGVAWKLPSSRMNNGSHGPDTNTAHVSWADPGSVVTFDLGLGAGSGWDISSVQSIAAWNSAGFGNQGYTLEMKLVGAGSYTTIATVLYNPLGGGGGATKVTLTDDGGLLASGVEFVRFTHNSVPGTSGNEVTYRELDVFGTPVAAGPLPPVAVDDTATFSENVDPNANTLLGLDGLATGLHTFNALGQDFSGYVEQHDGNGWLLIGRGREGWEFDTDGQGAIAAVSQNLGTSAAFAPAAYSDAQVQDLLDQAALGMVNIEMRLKRATAADGTGTYQDVRWRNFVGNGDVFTWNIEDSQYTVTQELKDLGGLAGQLQGTTNVTNTRDTFTIAGDDGDRIFTWAWTGHSNQQGFSYGASIPSSNSATTFMWDDNGAGYAIPYTEVYIRSNNGGSSLLANDSDPNGDSLVVTGAATSGVPTAGNFTTTSVLGADVEVFVNGSFDYDPSTVAAIQELVAGQQLIDSFTYLIDDGNGGTDDATVTITVTGVSDLVADSATLAEDDGGTVIDVLANDAQPGTVVTGVTIEDFSTEFSGRSAVDSINGTGLSGSVHNNSAADMWLSDNEETPLITFDLEGVYDLSSFHVWNYNESTSGLFNRGANLVELLVASTVGGPFTSLGNFNFAIADGSSAIPGETIDLAAFPAADSSRLVRFDIMSDHGGDNYTGLSEVRFFAAPVFVITSVTPNTDGGAGGSVTNNGTNVTYDPNGQFDSLNEGQTATDTFSYTITGGSSVTVTVTITGVSRGTIVRIR